MKKTGMILALLVGAFSTAQAQNKEDPNLYTQDGQYVQYTTAGSPTASGKATESGAGCNTCHLPDIMLYERTNPSEAAGGTQPGSVVEGEQ